MTKIFLKNEKKTSKNKQINNIQKKKGETDGLIILVLITDTAINVPKRQAPLSPKNICAFGKLNLRKINTDKIIKNKIYTSSIFLLIKLIVNKTTKIIKAWMLNKPLNPSIRFEPLTINKKHKIIKIREKISIVKR